MAEVTDASGFFIDKGQIGGGRDEKEDINFILSKADELARIYGFKCTEDLISSELLNPLAKNINILLLAS